MQASLCSWSSREGSETFHEMIVFYTPPIYYSTQTFLLHFSGRLRAKRVTFISFIIRLNENELKFKPVFQQPSL